MAESYIVAISKQNLPTQSEIEAFLKAESFPVTIEGKWNLLDDEGYLPSALSGKETGCEIFPLDQDDIDEFDVSNVGKHGYSEPDMGYELVLGDCLETTVATLLSYALAVLGKGVVLVDNDQKYSGDALRPWVTSALAEIYKQENAKTEEGMKRRAMEDAGDLAGQLAKRIANMKGSTLAHHMHGSLYPDLRDRDPSELADLYISGLIRLSFSDGTFVGASGWKLSNSSGLNLDSTHYATAMNSTLVDLRSKGMDTSEITDWPQDLAEQKIKDHLSLCQTVEILNGWGKDENVLAEAQFIAPNTLSFTFSDPKQTTLLFYGMDELMAASFRTSDVSFLVTDTEVMLS